MLRGAWPRRASVEPTWPYRSPNRALQAWACRIRSCPPFRAGSSGCPVAAFGRSPPQHLCRKECVFILQRVKDHGAGLVVKDPNCCRRLAAPVICPSDVASKDIIRALQPFEADHSCSGRFGIASLNCCFGERVDLLTGGRWLDCFGASIFRYSTPRIWNIELILVRGADAHARAHNPTTFSPWRSRRPCGPAIIRS